jgi:FKBP-type peptidyl-prolyl cis-trans isomerase FklB
MTHTEARDIVNKYFEELEAKMNAENIEKGKNFLAENAKKPGVVTLASGLQYEVIKEGNGKKPGAADKVKCHYEGTLIDGTLFDSSIKRGEPAVFGVSQVIKGWVEALQLMTEGSKWRLFIPSELAYGAQGAGEMIPPHSTLIFEVELIEVL